MLGQPAFEVRGDAGIERMVPALEEVKGPGGIAFFYDLFTGHAGNSNQLYLQ